MSSTSAILRHYFGRYKRRMAVIPVCSFLAGLADALALVMLAQVALTLADPEAALPALGDYGLPATLSPRTTLLVVVAATALRFVLQTISAWAAAGIVADVTIRARQSALAVFLDASWGRQSRFRQGELQQLLGEPVTRVSELTTHVTKMLTSSLNLVALLASAFLVDRRAAAAIAGVGLVLFTIFRPLVRFGREMSRRERDAIRDYGTEVSEIESVALEIQTFDVGPAVMARSSRLLRRLRTPLFRRHLVQPMLPYSYQAAVIMVVAGGLALLMSVGTPDLAAVGAIALLMVKSMGYGQSLQSSWQRMHFALPFADQLHRARVMHEELPADEGTVNIGTIHRIESRAVELRYDEDRPALIDLDFTIHRGEAIAVVGPSGSGKTSLMHLLLRLREPTAGRLLVNGTDLAMITLDSWYKKVAFVPQESHLLQGTIAENIEFRREGFSRADVAAAARAAGIAGEIEALVNGYDTMLGPRGSGLSGGQRQRVAIARALLGQPELLVLDEPTSALDGHSEAAIADTLRRLRGEITTVIVAHRMSTVAHCDRAMVFEEGRLTGFASPADLMADRAAWGSLGHDPIEAGASW